MKTFIVLLILIVTLQFAGAEDWQWQNPKPTGNRLAKVQFVDNMEYVLSDQDDLLKYDENFDVQEFNIPLPIVKGFAFLNADTGYVVGIFGKILRTTDCGQTWTDVFSPTRKTLNAIAFNGSGVGVAVGDSGTIIRSTDFGNTWSVQSLNTSKWLTSVTFLDDSFGIAAGHDGIVLRTEDAGNIWQEFTLPGAPRINRLINYHSFWGDSTVGAFGDNGSGFHGLRFGSSWTPVSLGTTADLLGGEVCPNGDIYVSGTEGTLLKSTDKGINWQSVVINTTATLASIGFFASGVGLIGADYGAVFRSNGCGDPWEQLQPQVVRSTLLAIYFITLLKGWAVGADGNILATVDGGQTWVKQTNGVPGFINDIHFIDENKGFAVGGVFNSSATVLRTDDGGANWTPVNTPAFNTLFDVHFIDSQIGFICGVDGQLYYTFNCGATWTTLFSGTNNWLLDIEFTSPDIGYIVGGNGTILKSENGGTLWNPLNSGIQEWLQAVSFLDDSIGVAVGNNETILRTTDAGLTWEDRTLNTPGNRSYSSVDMSAFLLKNGGQEAQGLAVGSDGALLFTQDGGLNWQEQQSGTGNDLFGLALLPDGSAYLCGEGGTILYSPSVTVGVEPLETPYVVDGFQLGQNYPNPFNPETTIQFDLPVSGNIQLVVFDMLGRRVRELVNENLASGSFQVRWDGRDDQGREVSSGIYVYQLIGNGIAESRKMMLLR